MKKPIAISLCFFLILSFVKAQLTAIDWQSDLRFFQTTVHQEYPFLFKKVTAKDFDTQVEQLYQDIPKLQAHEIVTGFSRIVSLFQYGHTDVIFDNKIAQFHRLPINFYQFTDGVYLQAVHSDYPQALGAKVLKIENMPIEAVLTAIRAVVPAENDQFFKSKAPFYLRIPEILHAQKVIPVLTNKVKFTLEKAGKTFEQTFEAKESFKSTLQYGLIKNDSLWLDARSNDKTPLYLKDLDKIYFYEYLPESKTVYIRHSQIQDDPKEAIPAFYARVFDFIEKNDVEKLVLDVRLNGGGNNYKNKPIVTGIIKSKINQKGKLFVIIGRRTFSACQNLVNELHNYTNAIFVGEPTAENVNFYGDTRRVELPKTKLNVALSFAWWQDKPQWENDDWLSPNVAVEMSFKDYQTNSDPVLDAALQFADKDFVLDPMSHLRELFQAQKLDKIESEAMRLSKDPRYKFYNLEAKLKQSGNDLIERNQMQNALYVFDLNTKLYPQSAKAWLSLAEGLEKAKQAEKATAAYQKAIEFGGDSALSEQARQKLKGLNGGK
jgi:Peptidase family S41